MKKVISLILAIGLMLGIVPAMAVGYEAEIGGITYTLENGEAIVTDCKWEVSGDVLIESAIEGCPVTKIGEKAFENCGQIIRITIPDSVKAIDRAAFYRCVQLKEVFGMANVETIGERAFHGCYALEKFTMPEKVTRIEFGTFTNTSFKEFVVGDNVRFIDDSAFSHCEIESITIGDAVTALGTAETGHLNEDFISKTYFDRTPIFQQCYKLKTVNLGKAVKNIYPNTFSNISSLENIFVDEENPYYTSVDGVLFTKDMKKLVCYPMGKSAAEYVIPEGVEEVCDKAFYNCKSEEVKAPESLEKIGVYNGVLDDAIVTSRAVTSGKQGDIDWVYDNGVLTFTGKGVLTDTFSGTVVYPTWERASGKKIGVNEGITEIDGMNNHENVTEIILPKTLEKIGARAFACCDSLEKIVIPENVSMIDIMAFDECESLKEVTVTSKVPLKIERSAFDIADGSVIYLPETVCEIHEHAFTNTFAVMHGGYGCYNEDCDITIDAPLGSYAYNWAIKNDFKVTDGKSEVKNIYGVLSVRRDVLFDKMKALGEAYGGLCTIDGVNLGLTKNGNYLAIIGDIVSYRENGMIVNENIYVNDEYVKLPARGIKAVLGCELDNDTDCIDKALINASFITEEKGDSVIIKGLKREVENLIIPATLNGKKVQLTDKAFGGNDTIKTVVLEDGIEAIPEGAFYGCESLEKADLGSVKRIDSNAFGYCFKLKEINLEKVEELGERAFGCCVSLEEVALLNLKEWRGITDDMLVNMTIPRWYHEKLFVHYSNMIYSPFYDCTGLKKATVRLPETDEESFPTLFTNCPNLGKVVLLNFTAPLSKAEFYSVRLAHHRFDDADRLTTRADVTIYSTDINAKIYAMEQSLNFEGDIESANDIWQKDGKLTASEELFNLPKKDLEVYKNTVRYLVLSEGVEEIPDGFFENWTNLSSVQFPRGLKKVGQRAFKGCTGLYAVKFSNHTLLEIGEEAFFGCRGLSQVSLYANVKIGDRAFADCSILSKVTMSDAVEVTLGEGVFNGCVGLSMLDLYNVKFEGLYPIAQPGEKTRLWSVTLCKGFTEELLVTDKEGNVIDRLPESVVSINAIGDNTKYASSMGAVYTKDMKTLCYCHKSKDMSSYQFPEETKNVYAGALKVADYKYLPNGVKLTVPVKAYEEKLEEPQKKAEPETKKETTSITGNAALGGTFEYGDMLVTTSILSEPQNGPKNMFDENYISYCVLYVRDEENPQYMQFDLGEVKNVEKLALAFRDATTRTTYFDVRVSSDGVNFETVIPKRGSNGDTNELQYFDINKNARYVRVYGYSNTFNKYWVSITEARVIVN